MVTKSKVLVDTSVLVDFLRQKDKKSTLLYKLASSNNLLFTSIICHGELHAGKSIYTSKLAKKELKVLLSGLDLIYINKAVSKKAGKIRYLYGIELTDCFIAATAKYKKLPLATLNTKHFSKVKNLKLYTA